MENVNLPLVSVPVITYNSSKTVLETLDSIFNQTYPNIELIISDDCSTDNTVEICKNWIVNHNSRFARVELLTVEKNTGVSANLNRAENACVGEWRKGIAGDDILLPNCIQDCMNYVTEHTDVIWLFGKMEGFGYTKEETEEYMNSTFDYSFFDLSNEEQLKYLLRRNCLPAPTAFVHIQRNRQLGVINDERIPMLEDYPKWINLIRCGVRFHYLDKTLVKYRLSENSLSTAKNISPKLKKSDALFRVYYICPIMWQFGKRVFAVHIYINAAPDAFDGFFWRVLYVVDRFITNILIRFRLITPGVFKNLC